jgi:hypothetical protein
MAHGVFIGFPDIQTRACWLCGVEKSCAIRPAVTGDGSYCDMCMRLVSDNAHRQKTSPNNWAKANTLAPDIWEEWGKYWQKMITENDGLIYHADHPEKPWFSSRDRNNKSFRIKMSDTRNDLVRAIRKELEGEACSDKCTGGGHKFCNGCKARLDGALKKAENYG